MPIKDGLVGDFLMWSFLGAAGVLVLTHAAGFSTAIGTAAAPIEYETGLIATAGGGSNPSSTSGTK